MAWQKISDKQYRISLDGVLTDIFVPHAKTEKIFNQFISSGGLFDEYGNVTTDPYTLTKNFTTVGDILLTTYGPKGSVIEEGDCSVLSSAEALELFKVASDIIKNFTLLMSDMVETTPEMSEDLESKVKKASK
jgi:hypothetical protein